MQYGKCFESYEVSCQELDNGLHDKPSKNAPGTNESQEPRSFQVDLNRTYDATYASDDGASHDYSYGKLYRRVWH